MRILPSALEKEIPVSNEIPIAGAPFGDLEREVGHSLDIEIWPLGFPLWSGPASVTDARQCSKLSDKVRLLGGAMSRELRDKS